MATREALALDVGGTFIKAARIAEGRVIGDVVRAPIPDFLDASGELGEVGHAREIDPAALDAVVQTVVAEVSQGLPASYPVYVSGQMAGLAFVDDSGAPLGPLISWQDTRVSNVAMVVDALGAAAVADLGDGLRVGSPVVTLSGFTRPADAHVTSLISYVAGLLAGQRAQVVHATDAGSWGMLNTRRMRWSDPACAVAGVSSEYLPRVTTAIEPVAPGASVMVAIADQQAALLGASLQRGWLSVNLATGCQVAMLADEFGGSGVQTRPYFAEGVPADLAARYLHTVTHLPAGRLLTAAVIAARGSATDADWAWVTHDGYADAGIATAVKRITSAIADSAAGIGGLGKPVVFSGGLVQKIPVLQQQLLAALGTSEVFVFDGDDAALAGLAILAEAN